MLTLVARLWSATAIAVPAVALAGGIACGEGTTRPAPGADGGGPCPDASYSATIQPLFDQYCRQCHRPGVDSGGLDLESHADTLAGGLGGPVVIPGECESSMLYWSTARLEQPYMPPGVPLGADEVNCICTWIDNGAPEN